MTETDPPRRRVSGRTVAAGVVGLEAAAGLASGLGIAVEALVGHPSDRGVALILAAVLVIVGAGLALVARGVVRARPSARTPAYLAQFFALVVGWYQRHTLPAVTGVVVAVAVVALAALSAPDTRDALRRH